MGRGTKEWAFKKGNGLKGFIKGGRAEEEGDGERVVVQVSLSVPVRDAGLAS